jgi:RNA-directed DNA polymerase
MEIGNGFFEGDFKSCFDTLDHDFISKQIERFPLYKLIKKFLKSRIM